MPPVHNPPFNLARGPATLTTAPPFDFSNVVMRVFPLKANPWTLRQFCRQTLDVAPGIVEFEPAMPFVFMQFLSYGRMSTEVANAGWVSQHEILFSVPLLWYRREGGRRVLEAGATFTPIVFVDQQSSQAIGREVYGWPKVLGHLEPGVSAWVQSPRDPLALMVLSTTVLAAGGGAPRPRRLVEIRHHPRPAIADLPPDWDDPLNPLFTVPRTVYGGLSATADLLGMLSGLGADGLLSDAATLQQRFMELLDPTRAAAVPSFNTINLKQFRAAEDPQLACFQALTNARMQLTRFNRGGLLGETRQLQGDLSGGFELRIFRYPSLPLVDDLGLEVVRQDGGPAGEPFAVLRPVCPFWIDVDFRYGAGEELCWRGRDGVWHLGGGAEAAAEPPTRPVYNAVLGGPSYGGPFSFPDATVRVLPLLARRPVLQSFVDRYLNQQDEGSEPLPRSTRFEVWGRYVYLLVASHESFALGSENLSLGAMRSAAFLIPLLWYEGDRLVSAAVVRAYMYTDSDAAAMTAQEVQGWPAVLARLTSPADPWMDPSGPAVVDRSLLRVETEVLQSLGRGQRSQRRLLIEIGARPLFADTDTPAWESVAASWGEHLLAELRRQQEVRRRHPQLFLDALALALEPLAQGRPILDVALRQFRDIQQPRRACYQGVSLSRTVIEHSRDLREMELPIHVGIHRYATEPIVDTLGLVVKARSDTADGVVDWLQPLRPFWMRLAMRTLVGEDVFYRLHSERWSERPGPPPASDRPVPRVGPGLVGFIDDSRFRRTHLAEAVAEWRGSRAADPAAAVAAIEPQLVLGALLSRGWGNRGRPPFWRRESDRDEPRRVPDFCVAGHSLGPLGHRFRELHSELCELQGYWYLQAPLVETADD